MIHLLKSQLFLLALLILLALLLRLYGLNWDQGQHLHPDERFLTMVTTALEWPTNLPQYFNTQHSPLNPHNKDFSFFVYGTFPVFLTKFLADLTGFTDYNTLTLLGRLTSALADMGVVFLIYLLSKKIFSHGVGLVATFFYTISVLPIQLAHFYTTDTFLNFFLTATVYLLIVYLYNSKNWAAVLGAFTFGLALASKINAVLLTPTIFLVFFFLFLKKPKLVLIWSGIFLLITFLTFRFFQPYAFTGTALLDFSLNEKFIANLQELSRLSQPDVSFPPAVQWTNTAPILYPLRDIILWGLGLPLGIFSLIAFLIILGSLSNYLFKLRLNLHQINPTSFSILVLVVTILVFFFYQGIQIAKPIRYFLTIYPYLAVLSGYLILLLYQSLKKKISVKFVNIIFAAIFVMFAIWPLSFISIYSHPHSRVEASFWIYQNIPKGLALSAEVWDDGLPLDLSPDKTSSNYQHVEFSLFGLDDAEKWQILNQKINNVDYIILSSNRLYGSMTRLPEKYPLTGGYYQSLFNNSLGFTKVAEFTSRPHLPLPFISLCLDLPFADYGIISKTRETCPPGITFVDDFADETFTVYDHPKVVIFKKSLTQVFGQL